MPTGWWSVNVMIAVLAAVMVGFIAVLATMLTVTSGDFDALTGGANICLLPISIGLIIYSMVVLGSFLPYRGSGRHLFQVPQEAVVERVEAHLGGEGVRFERDDQVDQIRRDRMYHVQFHFRVDGRDMLVLVRGRELGSDTVVFVSPWRRDEAFDAFVDGLERAVQG